jgi:hypothetical protein
MSTDSESGEEELEDFPKLHRDFIFDQIRNLRSSSPPAIPPDVKIVCRNEQILTAHKFVLCFASAFFQVLGIASVTDLKLIK